MRRILLNVLFGITTFAGAFLLFQVQLVMGKYILPWYGGSSAVWAVCMLFFQVMLLAGYLYAHCSIRYLPPWAQATLHVALLATAMAMLPVRPAERWMPTDASDPTVRILKLLTVSVGLPFLALAATGPLLQAWFSRLRSGQSQYRLYALSNAGSMLALLTYPVFFEPNLTRTAQSCMWGIALSVFAIACATLAIFSARQRSISVDVPGDADAASVRPTRGAIAAWLILPALASAMLLAITNKICQDVASVPLLWILPLAIYLLTFIICFDGLRWYIRRFFIPTALVAVTSAWFVLMKTTRWGVVIETSLYCGTLFFCCMLYHGELVRQRPHARWLTHFYVMIAAGGALGGFLVAIVAPLMFLGFVELQIGLLICGAYALSLMIPTGFVSARGRHVATGAIWVAAAGAFVWSVFFMDLGYVARSRSFYGVLTVFDQSYGDPPDPLLTLRVLKHGGITHGAQYLSPLRRRWPTAYYGAESGAGLALVNAPRQGGLRVGVVGLGAGTLAAYANPQDVFIFYELNPDVLRMATREFTFLRDSQAGRLDVILGDARMSLQRQTESQQFDVIILDAFSGDAIPTHLLTEECFKLYQFHLRRGGIIAVHITNHYLNLGPVVQKMAQHFNLSSADIFSHGAPDRQESEARWMLLSCDQALMNSEIIRRAGAEGEIRHEHDDSKIRLWTDDDTNILQILRY